jgi:hypothetical protein
MCQCTAILDARFGFLGPVFSKLFGEACLNYFRDVAALNL